MKTSDRILETSLILFNEEGEQNVTTVDIANEMDISPGNLYYHFKGKEVIIEILFKKFEAEMVSILRAPAKKSLNLEDSWFYLYVLFEEIHKFRFFYLNLTDILQRNAEMEKRFKRLIKLKKEAMEAIFATLLEMDAVKASPAEIKQLSDSVTLTLIYWFSYQSLINANERTNIAIHRGVYYIMSLIGPYFGAKQQEFYAACQELYEAVIQEDNTGFS